jgi:AraC-like DNA-binding protein
MYSWSTDDLPAAQRFAHWREERGKVAAGVTIELEPRQRANFQGRMSVQPVGAAALIDMQASAYHVSRTEADIGRLPGDSLIVSEQVTGGGALIAGGKEFFVTPGTVSSCHSDLPYVNVPAKQPGFRCRMVSIPLKPYRTLTQSRADLWLRPLEVVPGVPAMLASYFRTFVREAPHLSGVAAEHAVRTLAQLALMARGSASTRDEPGRAAMRESVLQKARDIVSLRFSRADLSSALVAAELGISERQLHRLFEPTGTSFSRYLLACRLEQACLVLRQHPWLTIADVAHRCGFDGVSTFYRVFRKAYGLSPADLRSGGEG